MRSAAAQARCRTPCLRNRCPLLCALAAVICIHVWFLLPAQSSISNRGAGGNALHSETVGNANPGSPLFCRSTPVYEKGTSDDSPIMERLSSTTQWFHKVALASPPRDLWTTLDVDVAGRCHPTRIAVFANMTTWNDLLERKEVTLAPFAPQSFVQSKTVVPLPETTLEGSARGSNNNYNGKRAVEQCVLAALQSPCSVGFQLLPPVRYLDEEDSTRAGDVVHCAVLFGSVNKDTQENATLLLAPGAKLWLFLDVPELRPSVWDTRFRLEFIHPTPHELFVSEITSPWTLWTQPLRLAVGLFRDVGELTLWESEAVAVEYSLFCAQDYLLWHARFGGDTDSRPLRGALPAFVDVPNGLRVSPCLNDERSWFATARVVVRSLSSPLEAQRRLQVLRIGRDPVLALNHGEPMLSRVNCAPLLAPDEFCLTNVVMRYAPDLLRDTVPSNNISRPVALLANHDKDRMYPIVRQNHSNAMVSLSIGPIPQSGAGVGDYCVTVSDGHVAYVVDGVAQFPNLVLRNRCSLASSMTDKGVDGSLRSDTPLSFLVRASLPFVEPIEIPPLRVNLSRAQLANVMERKSEWRSVDSSSLWRYPNARALISVTAHEDLDGLRDLLENIAAFVPHSVVVLHLSQSWTLTEGDWASLAHMNGTAHPLLFINPQRFKLSFSLLFWVQLDNAHYMATSVPWQHFTHVMLISANERFFRGGVLSLLRRYDVSRCAMLPGDGGLAMFHSFPGGVRHDPRFVAAQEHIALAPSHSLWPQRKPPYGLQGSLFWLAPKHRSQRRRHHPSNSTPTHRLSMAGLPTQQAFTEGSYFNKSIALALYDELTALFPHDALDNTACFTNWYSWSEVVPYSFVEPLCASREGGAVCGPRFGTVAWNRPGWGAGPRDIWWGRCSPFSSVFSIKRISPLRNDVTRRLIQRLTREEVVTLRNCHRDNDGTGTLCAEVLRDPLSNPQCSRYVPVLHAM